MGELEVTRRRGGLHRTAQRILEGHLTIGFIGGSITDGRGPHNWPEPVVGWFLQQYPGLRVQVENAAIGATGSDLAVFRAQADLIDRGCDLVFVEFAVNDGGAPTERRQRTREGLLRKLLADGTRDVVITYTYSQDMYDSMARGEVPATIAEFEELAAHYGLGSVWMALDAFQEVKAGTMLWEEWLPDGLHPHYRGSLSYAQSVMRYLEQELLGAPVSHLTAPPQMPRPLNGSNWESAAYLPFAEVTLAGPWATRRWLAYPWIDSALVTAAIGSRLSFDFEGRTLVLGFDFGKSSSEFRYRIDGGEWMVSKRERPAWCGNEGWFRPEVIAEDLPLGRHSAEFEVIHGNTPECTGTNFRLGFIGVVR